MVEVRKKRRKYDAIEVPKETSTVGPTQVPKDKKSNLMK